MKVEEMERLEVPRLGRNVAVFLDRDGTICRDVHYMSRPGQLELLSRVADGIRVLNSLAVRVTVVTNQSGVARGYLTEDDLARIHKRMVFELCKKRATLDGIYYCPHHPDEGCTCRKPKTGLFKKAERDFHLDLNSSYMIGDRETDVEAGWNARCTSILVRSSETENGIRADYVASNLYEAAKLIERDLRFKGKEMALQALDHR